MVHGDEPWETVFLKGSDVSSFPLQVNEDTVPEGNTNLLCWLGFGLVFFLFFLCVWTSVLDKQKLFLHEEKTLTYLYDVPQHLLKKTFSC